MRRRVFARDDHTCVLCGSGEDLQCDHVHEVRNGGLPDMDNLRTLCATCHRARKGEA
nr:HNH endonuclease [Luteibacter yeojuensis]